MSTNTHPPASAKEDRIKMGLTILTNQYILTNQQHLAD